jgi:hypothetical protein
MQRAKVLRQFGHHRFNDFSDSDSLNTQFCFLDTEVDPIRARVSSQTRIQISSLK